MNFNSVINFPFQLLRVFFIIICLITFALIIGLYKPIEDISFIPWYAKILIAIGVIWGGLYTFIGLFRGLSIVGFRNDTIYINILLTFKRKYYSFDEIEKITEKEYYDSRFSFNGIEVKFRNGDSYDFVSYNYLNYKKLKEHFLNLKKRAR